MRRTSFVAVTALAFTGALAVGGPPGSAVAASDGTEAAQATASHLDPILRLGKAIFRFDTFGDEQLWTGVLRMPEALSAVDPQTALSVGLKVDVDALPRALVAAIRADGVDLTDPLVTRELLRLNAVVGVRGRVDAAGKLTSVGITCALCHSTVDDSVIPGIGHRLDGWANTSLDVGAILGLSPALDPALKAEFATWGPGKYDPRHHYFDGTALVPLNPVAPDHHPADLRAAPRRLRDGQRRRADLLLEQLRRRRPDGRPRLVPRSPPRASHHAAARPRDAEAAAAADLSAQPRDADAAARQLRPRRRVARRAGVPRGGRLRPLPSGIHVHRRPQRVAAALAGAARPGGSRHRGGLRGAHRDEAVSDHAAARDSSSTRRTSTMGAPPISRPSSTTTSLGSG